MKTTTLTVKEILTRYEDELIDFGIENEYNQMKYSLGGDMVIMDGWAYFDKEDAADEVLSFLLNDKKSLSEIAEMMEG